MSAQENVFHKAQAFAHALGDAPNREMGVALRHAFSQNPEDAPEILNAAKAVLFANLMSVVTIFGPRHREDFLFRILENMRDHGCAALREYAEREEQEARKERGR